MDYPGFGQYKHRHSIRLKGYDCSRAGMYFVAIVTWQRNYYEHIVRNKREWKTSGITSNPIPPCGQRMMKTPTNNTASEQSPGGRVYLYTCVPVYLAFTVIILGLTSSAFGRLMVRMPFSNSALALSPTTMVGRAKARSKAP